MSHMLKQSVDLAITSWTNRDESLAAIVMRLERIVDEAENTGDPHASKLRQVWGQLEILNALAQDEEDPEEADYDEVLLLLKEFRGSGS